MLQLLQNRLMTANIQQTNQKKQRFVALTAKLDALSPLKVLSRGYAMAQKEDGQLIRSAVNIKPDDLVVISLADCEFSATVNEVKERAL